MCCGTAQNSYQTLKKHAGDAGRWHRIGHWDSASREAFEGSHDDLLAQLAELGRRTRADAPLAERIRDKFKIKNTCGYSLNALVDYEDPSKSSNI